MTRPTRVSIDRAERPQPAPRSQTRPASRLALLLAAAALVAGLAAAPAAAQGLRLQGLGGEELRESDLASQPTIVVVWASWSPRGRDVVQRVKGLVGRWGSRARVITVNFQEDRATVEKFLAGQNLGAPVFLDTDGAFSKKYSVTNLPGLVVFKDGDAAYRGKLPDDADAVIVPILGR
jgi:thiol-disulfide isomerase/thioredoxin